MALNTNLSYLDPGQIINRSFDKTSDRIRVDAEVTATIVGPQEVIISDIDDSIKIGNGSGTYATLTTLTGKNGIDVNIIGGSVTTSGTSTVTGSVSITGAVTTNTNINGLANFNTAQFTVGTSAVNITAAYGSRSVSSLKAITTSTNIIYIGNSSSVTISTGYPLFNGDSIQLDITTPSIWAIATAAAQTLCELDAG